MVKIISKSKSTDDIKRLLYKKTTVKTRWSHWEELSTIIKISLSHDGNWEKVSAVSIAVKISQKENIFYWYITKFFH